MTSLAASREMVLLRTRADGLFGFQFYAIQDRFVKMHTEFAVSAYFGMGNASGDRPPHMPEYELLVPEQRVVDVTLDEAQLQVLEVACERMAAWPEDRLKTMRASVEHLRRLFEIIVANPLTPEEQKEYAKWCRGIFVCN